jgi:hypothetical protein
MKKHIGVLAAVLATLATSPAHAFDWSDTSLGWSYGPDYHEPSLTDHNGNAQDIGKNTISFTHIDGYKYGTNFFNVDMLLSNSADPANNSNSGATEFYAIYRHNLSMNAVTGSQAFALGPLKDLALDAGFILGSKNNAFASNKRAIVVGPNLIFNVPGHFDVALLYYKENNNNGIAGTAVNFRGTWSIESAWGIPFHVGSLPLSLEGFLDVVGPKGKDGFNADTKTEVLFRPKLMFDLGALAGHKNLVRVGFGWEYWMNKYGTDHRGVKGALQSTPFVTADIHF